MTMLPFRLPFPITFDGDGRLSRGSILQMRVAATIMSFRLIRKAALGTLRLWPGDKLELNFRVTFQFEIAETARVGEPARSACYAYALATGPP
jgi:hypothetical protein